MRYDGHDHYADAVSYNTGVVWSPDSAWVFKLLHGTAYRTPYAIQLREDETIHLEKIINFSAQAAWRPSERLSAAVVLFNNRLDKHVMEDPYAGLSNPNHQDIYGIEAELSVQPTESIAFSGNLTLMDNSGPDEVYRYNDYSYIDEETGELVKHYIDLEYPYDPGAKRLFNFSATWRPVSRLTTTATARYIGPRDLIYPRGESTTRCESVWLLDWSATIHRFFHENADFTLSIKNLLDEDYLTPWNL